jgi:hypothetical protein
MKTKSLMSILLMLTLTLAACGGKPSTPSKPTATSLPQKPVPTATRAPTKVPNTPTAKPTVAPTKPLTPTPVAALPDSLMVKDQSITANSVVVNTVTAEKPSWVVIFTDQNGQPGTVLGYAIVPAGTSNNVKVTIDPKKATSKMIAMLVIDTVAGKFQYPNPDAPVTVNGNKVMTVFGKL